MDRLLTNPSDPSSYLTEAFVNGNYRFLLDLRNWEQKFAYYYGTIESRFVETARRLFREGAFYDVGASIGLYSVIFGKICASHGTVVRAIEPIPANCQRLRQQLPLNGLDEQNVDVNEVALGESEGIVDMVLTDAGKREDCRFR